MNTKLIILFVTAVAAATNLSAEPALKDVFKDDFLVGAALNETHFSGVTNAETELTKKHFNTITPENVLKWESVHPEPGKYDFSQADRFVEFGQKHGMWLVGHTLVWHQQTPDWVFKGEDGKPVTREVLLERMREHIHSVVGRYKGKIKGWDVVNEAVAENGSLRESQWMKIIGEDYISKAFEFAHEADPDAELYYNDYSLEDQPKRKGALELMKKLQAKGVKLAGIGLQGHYGLERPVSEEVDNTIREFADLGLKVMITELDVNVLPSPHRGGAEVSLRFAADPKWNPYTNGLPEEVEQRVNARYRELFQIFSKHKSSLTRVTFWGVTDANSWLNDWPVRGRTNYPLLFDRAGKPKPAFEAVIRRERAGDSGGATKTH